MFTASGGYPTSYIQTNKRGSSGLTSTIGRWYDGVDEERRRAGMTEAEESVSYEALKRIEKMLKEKI